MTGVQTCALPISCKRCFVASSRSTGGLGLPPASYDKEVQPMDIFLRILSLIIDLVELLLHISEHIAKKTDRP